MTSLDAEQEGEAKSRCNICDRIFKNEQGVRIHQGKYKCKEYLQQRKASNSTQRFISEFISFTCAETVQSTRRGGEPERLEDFERKPRLNLPASADYRCVQLDELPWITS